VTKQTVQFGMYIPQVSFTFREMLDRAVLCEELGIASFWLYDHLYAPGTPDIDALEGWTLATALLASTSTLRVGHMVIDNNLRHPVLLAKMATTLDVISDGRLNLGIGSGSYEAEHHEGGFPWGSIGERTERLAESLEIITRMFEQKRTTVEGRHFSTHEIANLPQPVQKPRPPIYVGGVGERYTLPLVARYADVWNVPTYGLAELDRATATLNRECEKHGRDPASVRRSLEAVLVLAPDEAGLEELLARAERRYQAPGWGLHEGGFIGTPEAVTERIAKLVDDGFTEFIFFPSDRGGGSALRLFAEQVIPNFRADNER
jgi:alkanesulfonate monooxygenase SsuD/methylene tetrahydromethanopterin reductase-like flavin-dependent oxidoreductase (luciferase family)